MKISNDKKISIQSIILMQGSALIFSLSNIFSKMAAREKSVTVKFCVFYSMSLIIMGIYAVLWQQILKRVSMIVAYSNRLVAMIWGIVWGILIFKEKITIQVVIGTIIIFLGLYIMVNDDE